MTLTLGFRYTFVVRALSRGQSTFFMHLHLEELTFDLNFNLMKRNNSRKVSELILGLKPLNQCVVVIQLLHFLCIASEFLILW